MRHVRVAVIETPYKADSDFGLRRNLAYARAVLHHVTMRGDAPVASHLTLTQVLDDRDPDEREAGIAAGLALLRVADLHVFGTDLGISRGMQLAAKVTPGRVAVEQISLPEWKHAAELGTEEAFRPLIERYEPKWWKHE